MSLPQFERDMRVIAAATGDPKAIEFCERLLATRPLTCVWTREDEDADSYGTACGHVFEFTTGGPAENEARFCIYCGGALVVADAP